MCLQMFFSERYSFGENNSVILQTQTETQCLHIGTAEVIACNQYYKYDAYTLLWFCGCTIALAAEIIRMPDYQRRN